jgi:tRNA nucleotidyltransferase (CCA-adding enzyme)
MTTKAPDPYPEGTHLGDCFAPLRRQRSLQLMVEAAGGADCHLVGGAVRDTVLGLGFRDLDVVVERDGPTLARRVASALPARLVELGGDRFAAFRLVADDQTLDIWDRQGKSLESDLARRDLTLHSVAVGIETGEVIDPFHGMADLQNRVLRATSETSFSSDPLRVLRLARFAGQLPGFAVTDRTLELAAGAAAHLDRVAGERIRVELERVLELPDFLTAAQLLVQLSLYPRLWQPHPDRDGFRRESQEPMSSLRHLETLLDGTEENVERSVARQALLLARSAGGDAQVATSAVESCQKEGLVTRATAKRLGRLLHWSRLPRDTANQRWFLHRNGDLWPTAACFLAARDRWPATSSAFQDYLASLTELCLEFGAEIFDPRPLVTGTDLVSRLGLPEGKLVGEILEVIHRQRVEGRLASRDEAWALANKLASQGSSTTI